jgi:hypothetical protein
MGESALMRAPKTPKACPSEDPSRTRSDLTGYAALLGESFSTRVNLLERVIRGSHHPSLGRYKERLLAELLREYIPRTFEVGTGFVLFPHEDVSPPGGALHHDPLNQSAFAISRQCDLLIFDASSVPPVFRDGDFVVIRPDAVRAVIEVKGALTLPETTSLLESFLDFGKKWRTTQLFYKSHHQKLIPAPELFGMAWTIQTRSDGRPVTTPVRIRERIARFYQKYVPTDELQGFPVLSNLLVHNECEICHTTWSDEDNGQLRLRDGWVSCDGRFTRFDAKGIPYRDKDRTIATLLGAVQCATAADLDSFNRFFSYVDETRNTSLIPYAYGGFSTWYELTDNTKPYSRTV